MTGLFGGYALRFSKELSGIESDAADKIVKIVARARIPLVVHSMYAAACPVPLQRLGRAGVPVVESLEVGASCVKALRKRGAFLREPARRVNATPLRPRKGVEAEIDSAIREDRTALDETETRSLISRYGVTVAPAVFCSGEHEVAVAIADAGTPVAVKIVSSSILHKTDAGGVMLNVSGPEEGIVAYRRVLEAAADYAARSEIAADVRGVLVAPMLPAPIAELIVGAKRDPQFGPVLTVGAGGLAVELLEDAALRILPIDGRDAREILDELRISPLLHGYRRRPTACLDCLVDILLGVADCVLRNPEISALEANPVFVYPDRAVAVDVRGLLGDMAAHPNSSAH